MRIQPFFALLLLTTGAWTPAVAQTAPVAHLFVHPLLAFPERAFNASSKDESRMDEWFITVDEFRRTLGSLEARGYMLVRASDVFRSGSSGLECRVPDLPRGRKPLLLSVDDLNYYPFMKANGTVSRLWVDGQGRLMTQTDLPGGGRRDDSDREVPQVLENFIAAHPDFAFQGARGLIGLTGYAGVFGWRTQEAPSPQQKRAVVEARKVAEALRALGWEFASHSFAHRSQKNQDFAAWTISESRWKSEVEPLIGPTPFYIFPYGEAWWKDRDRWESLKTAGFQVFFGVERNSDLQWQDNLPIAGRVPLDGRGLRNRFGALSPFLDLQEVWDQARPATMKY